MNDQQETPQPQYRQFSFTGTGVELFKIYIVNWVLSIITLGLYYPWAKASQLKYKYQHTVFDGSNFVFHGTGREIFKGFIKVVGFVVAFYAITFGVSLTQNPVLIIVTILVLYLLVFLLIPFALHGSFKYRASRSSWRGIHFGYRGQQGEFVRLFLKNSFFTIITFGLFGAWFIENMRRYVLQHLRFGNITFDYVGDGANLFVKRLIGGILTFLTLGIYYFWFQMDMIKYFVDNIRAEQNGKNLYTTFDAKGGDYFVLSLVNILLLIFTLGLGFAWVEVRTLDFVMQHLWVEGEFDANTLTQTESEYKDASGDDVLDMLDLDLGVV